jgi:SAM-dependent methyltransferase
MQRSGDTTSEIRPPDSIWPQSGSFVASGLHSLRLLVEHAALKPRDRVLDIGCGPSRLGFALAQYLNEHGSYDGFDVRREAIDWCRSTLSKEYPHFRFQVQHVDVFNGAYNRTGSVSPSTFTFPYPDNSMDVVVLFSVFTHMLPREVRHYLDEITRVLRPAGRAVASWLLLDEAGTRHAAGRDCVFSDTNAGYFTVNPSVPEQAIAFREEVVRSLYAQADLEVVDPIIYGRPRSPTAQMDQDVVIARKP